ncbi:MAG: putative shikimate-kinase [Actinomycetia bacterium]|jgi:shikimate kinase|nr:putative shikimate-kinase [Actinomycetes bacterium]MDQ1646515.1 shikimate kinase [Cryptosporangiaceae bacterium]MDQ1653259.1 shikimate kinase [Cryptosporangiaceae bacterium]MDQ1655893.1 shikimate kinase [Cryptosporangiaceae bacterium]
MAVPSPTRVVLLGLMGSGKTTVGSLLARRTGWPYLDSDDLLAQATGRTLAELAALGGEQLHDAERDILEDVLHHEAPVIASAAAAIVGDPTVTPLLHHHGAFTVYLHVPPDVLTDRIGGDTHRPWLQADPAAVLKSMYQARDELYREAASYTVDATGSPDEIAHLIYLQLPRPL